MLNKNLLINLNLKMKLNKFKIVKIKKIKKVRRHLVLKIISYRKNLKNLFLLKSFFLNNNLLVSHFVSLSFVSSLIKDYFISEIYQNKINQNFFPFLLNKLNQNYLYNYNNHKFMNKSIFLPFSKKFSNFSHQTFIFQSSIVPYNLIPFGLISSSNNAFMELNQIYSYLRNYKYYDNFNFFYNFFYIEKIKEILVLLLIFIVKRIKLFL